KAFTAHPDGKALLLIHPSYEGIASIDKELIDLAKSKNLKIIVDEAHGGHFPFHPGLPPSALALGADLVVQGSHKTSGSLTQSGMLHLGREGDQGILQDALALVQTTSPSYLLMASLDGARHQLVMEGNRVLAKVQEITAKIRKEIRGLKGFRPWYAELYNDSVVTGLDFTKIILDGLASDLSGYELAEGLRKEAGIQVEMATTTHVLAMFGLGNDCSQQERLIEGLKKITVSRGQVRFKARGGPARVDYTNLPALAVTPRESFFANKTTVPLKEAGGKICGELVTPYPPGIPLLCPGERISAELVEQLEQLKSAGTIWQGPQDPVLNNIRVLK
ncbi:MAG: decarboxylase, partial [Bacillota bacterium]